jgi:hypothetical protein
MQMRWDLEVLRQQKGDDGGRFYSEVVKQTAGKRKRPEGEIAGSVRDKVFGFETIQQIEAYFKEEE